MSAVDVQLISRPPSQAKELLRSYNANDLLIGKALPKSSAGTVIEFPHAIPPTRKLSVVIAMCCSTQLTCGWMNSFLKFLVSLKAR
jgi:hypothetical protein